jgi:hypothetical protein
MFEKHMICIGKCETKYHLEYKLDTCLWGILNNSYFIGWLLYQIILMRLKTNLIGFIKKSTNMNFFLACLFLGSKSAFENSWKFFFLQFFFFEWFDILMLKINFKKNIILIHFQAKDIFKSNHYYNFKYYLKLTRGLESWKRWTKVIQTLAR